MLHLRELWLYQKRLGTWWTNSSVNLSVEAGIVDAEARDAIEGINLALYVIYLKKDFSSFLLVGKGAWSTSTTLCLVWKMPNGVILCPRNSNSG